MTKKEYEKLKAKKREEIYYFVDRGYDAKGDPIMNVKAYIKGGWRNFYRKHGYGPTD